MGHHHHHHGHHEDHHHGYGYGYVAPSPPANTNHCHSPAYVCSPCSYAPTEPDCVSAPYLSHPSSYQLDQTIADRHRHSRNEHLAEAGAAAAGAFSMYEVHQAKVDPVHAQRHRIEAGAAGAAALGSAAYAFHEHHEKKKNDHLIHSLNGHYQATDHGHNHHH